MATPAAQTAVAPPPFDQATPECVETATFGMGCFWGPDAAFGAQPGVVRTRVGYAGGTTADPTYRSIGDHTEVVQIDYDPEELAYEDVLALFWEGHNASMRRTKRQYRSVILASGEAQEEAACASMEHRAKKTGQTLRTEVERLDRFYLAEDYHQKYRLRRIQPLREAFMQLFGGDEKAFAQSPAVTRANGYVAGHGTLDQFDREAPAFGLPGEARRDLRDHVT